MKKLFEIDTKDYNINGTVKVRPSVRAIIIRNNRLAMVHSLQYDYYKFPGGGIEEGENHSETLIHEVREESVEFCYDQLIELLSEDLED